MAYQRILVPVDGSPASSCALKEATQLAREQHARFRIIHVIDVRALYLPDGISTAEVEDALRKEGDRVLAQAKETARQQEVPCETALLAEEEPIAKLITDDGKKWGADLIVLGTHGRHGVGRLLLGSVAEHVARMAEVPVMLVHEKQEVCD